MWTIPAAVAAPLAALGGYVASLIGREVLCRLSLSSLK